MRATLRQLRKSPGFTALVALTIALGVGANTAIFSIVNGLLLRPLPVSHPEQLVVLAARTKSDALGLGGLDYRLSYPALTDLRARAGAFSDLLGYTVTLNGLASDGKAYQFLYSCVTGNFFTALGVKPALGRVFSPGEGEKQGADRVIVLGYAFWQKRFGGDPGVIGKQVSVDGRAATVVGVAPPEFHGLFSTLDMDGYMPLNNMSGLGAFRGFLTDRGRRPLVVAGRLKPGTSRSHAQAAVNAIARNFAEQHPDTDSGISVRVIPEPLARPVPLASNLMPMVGGLFLVLAGLVLVLACMNTANMLLARAMARQREMAIRAALGSGRARLVRQMLSESMLVAALGGFAGVLLGCWVSAWLSSAGLKINIPVVLDYRFDWRVFAYSLAAVLFAGVFAGIWPALRASRADVSAVLHDGGTNDTGGAGRLRLRSMLVVAQIAGSLMLLAAAGLFVRQLQRSQRADLGFEPDHLLNAIMDPHLAGFDEPRTKQFYRALEDRVRALPGVQAVSLAYSVPMGYYNNGDRIYVEGRQAPPGEQIPLLLFNAVDAGYFETLCVPLLRGRAFRESDDENAPRVAVINQTMASRFWPHADAIGKRFRTGSPAGPLWEVVGVAATGKYLVTFEPALPYFYVPLAQKFESMRVLQIRSAVAPEALAGAVEREIRALDPNLPIFDIRSMRQALAGITGFRLYRVGASLAAAMGLIGLALAVVGIYGLASFAAGQRTREIGLRMALGAAPLDVLGLILRQGVRLVVTGIATGLAGTWVLTRWLSGFLVFVSAADPLAIGGVTLLLAAITLWACWLPARRAMRVDPIIALRHE